LSLPALLSQTAGKDAWIAALIGSIIEIAILFPIIFWLSRKDEKSIYESLRWKVLGKIVMAVFFCVFFYEILILTEQTYNLINGNLFDYVPYYVFSLPLLFMGVFFCFQPTRSIFRSGELFFVFIIIGIALSVFPALGNISGREVLPVFSGGAKPIFNAVLKSAIYFESALFLLMFKGEIKIEKHFCKKFMTTAILLSAFFVFFVFMFYALFGPLASTKTIAITNFTTQSKFITASGRLDWVLITMWLLLIMLRFGITFFCAFKCTKFIVAEAFKKFERYNGVITLVLTVLITIAVYCVYTFAGVIPYV
jgi:spore germination protein KB